MSGQCEKVLYTLLHCLRQNVLPQGGDKAGQKAWGLCSCYAGRRSSPYGTNLWSLSPCGVRPIRMHWGVKLAKGCCLARKTVFWQEKADVSHSSSTWPPEVKTRVYHWSIWFCFFSYKHSKNRLYIETHSHSDLIYIEGSVLLFALLSFTSVLTDSTLLYWLYFSYTQMSWQWPRLRLRPPQWGKQDSLLYWSL